MASKLNESTMSSRKLDQFPDEELVEMIEKFDELRLGAHREGRFLDADAAKKKIKELNDALDKRRKKDMNMKHNIEKGRLDNEFSIELDQFNTHWDEKIKKYKEECTKLEELLLEKQKSDFENYEMNLEENIALKPKDSAKLLEAKNQINMLAKNQEYQDAHNLQLKMLKLEHEEENKYRIERETKIRNHLDQLATRQKNEHNSLRKKIITGLEELEIKREKEYEMLLHKYNNLKKTVENQQSMETQMYEKSVRTANKLNRSTLNNFNKGSGVKKDKGY